MVYRKSEGQREENLSSKRGEGTLMSMVGKVRRNIGRILKELRPEEEERVTGYIAMVLRSKGYTVKVFPLTAGFEIHFTNVQLERKIRVFEPDYVLAHTEASGSVELSPFRIEGYYPLEKYFPYWLARENAAIDGAKLLDIGCSYSYFHETKYSFHMHFNCPIQCLNALLDLFPAATLPLSLKQLQQLQYCYEP